MKTQTYEIHSLSEYFSVIERLGLQNYISRGESQKFPGIQSSAFRSFPSTGKFYGQKHLQEFFSLIGNSLTALQQKHFTAFAQHSGLPTNLIDFTTSPLVSLFFASFGEPAPSPDSGYVYFLKKDRLFSVNDLMEKGYSGNILQRTGEYTRLTDDWLAQFDYEKTCRYFDYDEPNFLNGYSRMIISFLKLIENQMPDYRMTEMAAELTETCRNMENEFFRIAGQPDGFSCLNQLLYRALVRLIDIFSSGDVTEDIVRTSKILDFFYESNCLDCRYFRNSPSSGEDYLVELGSHQGEEPIYKGGLLFYLLYIASEFAMYSTECSFYLPFYATYEPPNISGRISMQNSIFICQTWFDGARHRNQPEPEAKLVIQQILPDITVKICNKSKILAELDMVGINLKTIYGDNDNIARYIKNKL